MNISLHGHSFLNHDGLWTRVDGTGEGGLGDGAWGVFPGRTRVPEDTTIVTGYSMTRSIGRVYPPRYRQGC